MDAFVDATWTLSQFSPRYAASPQSVDLHESSIWMLGCQGAMAITALLIAAALLLLPGGEALGEGACRDSAVKGEPLRHAHAHIRCHLPPPA